MMAILLDYSLRFLSGTSVWKRDHWPLSKQYAYEGDHFSLYHSRENSPENEPYFEEDVLDILSEVFYSLEVSDGVFLANIIISLNTKSYVSSLFILSLVQFEI